MTRAIVLAVFALNVGFAADEDPVEVLMRLRDKVMTHAARLPNYTCIETIQRDRYDPAGGAIRKSCDELLALRKLPAFASSMRRSSSDRLRLDVALTSDREMYSWVGAARFTEGEIDELIPEGAMGTGPYAALLISVFERRNSRFNFEGDTTERGRAALEYTFSVSKESSHYRVRTNGPQKDWLITAYTGTPVRRRHRPTGPAGADCHGRLRRDLQHGVS